MKKQSKPTVNKHLLLTVTLLFVFGLGLVIGWRYPGAVVLLLAVLGVVAVALLSESFHLWRSVNRKQLKKPLPSRRGAK